MAIELPEGLPALRVLEAEGHFSGLRTRGRGWQPRPLEIAVLNLMPNKPATEVQLARLLAAAPFDARVTLLVPDGYVPHTTPAEHLARFYRSWSTVRHRRTEILDWTNEHVARAYYICWGAMAALYHFHGVRTPVLPEKRFGVFEQTVRDPSSPYLRGFGDEFPVPASRRAELEAATLPEGGLRVLADSAGSGVCLLEEPGCGALYMFNHLEHEATTLRDEYFRDLAAGEPIALPARYFPGDDPSATPVNRWRPFAQLLFTNWLAEVSDAALPSDESERSLDWLLSEPTPASGAAEFADFLLVADEAPRLLPTLLQRIEAAGHRSLTAKVHHTGSGRALVELRVGDISDGAAERLVRRLVRSPEVRRIVRRGGYGPELGNLRRTCSIRSVHCSHNRRSHRGTPELPDIAMH